MGLKNKGLVLGVYEPASESEPLVLTPAAQSINSRTGGKLVELLAVAGKKLKAGHTRVLHGVDKEFSSIAVSCIGKQGQGYNELEEIDESRESVRTAVGGGVKVMRDLHELDVSVDPCGHPEAAAEGSNLALFVYDELKDKDKRKPHVWLSCYTDHIRGDAESATEGWRQGTVQAEGQNFARLLMETPANHMTPTIFANRVLEKLGILEDFTINSRDMAWAEHHKMGAFLSVTQGSVEPPLFLEIEYRGAPKDNSLFALVGKGVTFDSGGISLKPGTNMDKMRADMGGAACVVGALLAIGQLKLPINIRGFIPLCENMPSGKATKPGDVVTAMNGKTIQVDNTDAEGRLILADALCYAETFKPSHILDIATLTGAMAVSLGSGVTGVFSNSTPTWDILHKAGARTGDRVWRMPLMKHYSKQVTKSDLADVNNIGTQSREGGSCTAAAFLKEFVTNKNWLHLDIAGVMMNKAEVPYLGKGMSGRPTRTLVEFLRQLSKMNS
ncbi:cytosol aminopeptidase-like isoform X2 [Gigantopelta aegis]|uniref:cytosol aminopeptidase-like isoform X2 n=1 Tax=Gigantopelta aegis TaxID=1735272 RepID=UPI001B88D6ED|nr:cytosol aminopeptidase-like isoform X2 [Gigantopelta aegis]